jgi:hypothetical protein
MEIIKLKNRLFEIIAFHKFYPKSYLCHFNSKMYYVKNYHIKRGTWRGNE